jgi:hypothetical protein
MCEACRDIRAGARSWCDAHRRRAGGTAAALESVGGRSRPTRSSPIGSTTSGPLPAGAGELARRGTVVDCLKLGRRRLNTDLLIAVVRALHPDKGYVAQWIQALRVVLGESQAAAQDKLPDDLASSAADAWSWTCCGVARDRRHGRDLSDRRYGRSRQDPTRCPRGTVRISAVASSGSDSMRD